MKNFIKKLFEDRKIRFLFVGVLNTIVGYGAYALCIFAGLHYFIAQLIASVIGITHSYLWNKFFTFRVLKRSVSEAVRFVLVYAAAYGINMILLYVMIDKAGMNAYIAGAAGLITTTIISYTGHKYISFRIKDAEEIK